MVTCPLLVTGSFKVNHPASAKSGPRRYKVRPSLQRMRKPAGCTTCTTVCVGEALNHPSAQRQGARP